MRKLLIGILSFSLLVGCASVKLPEYNPPMPVKPVLEEMPDEELSAEAYRNLASLMAYSEELEIVVGSWESFYSGVRKTY